MRAFLWCNGDIPSLQTIKSLGNLSPLFGVDGGTAKAKSCGFMVKETLGDLDSISKDTNIEMTYLSDDSHSDLTKTIQELSKRGFLEFDILGIDGGSPGHILGIWGTLAVPLTNAEASFSAQLVGVLAVNIFVFIVAYLSLIHI